MIYFCVLIIKAQKYLINFIFKETQINCEPPTSTHTCIKLILLYILDRQSGVMLVYSSSSSSVELNTSYLLL